jgi:hypothetical protein
MKGKDRGNIEVYKRNGYTVTLTHDTQQLFLKNELALLVFLTALICFVVLPSYCFLALSAVDVAHDMFSRCHVTFDGIGLSDVHNIIEEVGFAMLAAEIPTYNVIIVCKVRLASFAAEDLVGGQVDVVRETHSGWLVVLSGVNGQAII